MSIRVLIADDEADMRNLLRITLQAQGYETLEAQNGRDVYEVLEGERIDLLILDMMMPEVDGWDVLKKLDGKLPILVLSARGSVEDRVKGLNLGASDYLVKPFDLRELIARVQVLLRRSSEGEPVEDTRHLIRHKQLLLNTLSKEVRVGEQELDLTPKEYEVLEFLAKHPGLVFSREQIVERLWGYDYTGDVRAVDTHIKKLRVKIREAEGDPGWIVTVWGFGYKFEGKSS